jgi:hypothetical protein
LWFDMCSIMYFYLSKSHTWLNLHRQSALSSHRTGGAKGLAEFQTRLVVTDQSLAIASEKNAKKKIWNDQAAIRPIMSMTDLDRAA